MVTTSVRYARRSINRDAVEKTSSGPVTSRICAESKVTMTIRGALIGVSIRSRVGLWPMADIVNDVSL